MANELKDKEQIEELREIIQLRLYAVPKGERIHIEKSALEKLLFDSTSDGKGLLPVWSGDFLSRIDLSEISFENVYWRNARYVNTNARIDFSKSYRRLIDIDSCSFEGTDLSNNTLQYIYLLHDVNFSNTGINVDDDSYYCHFLGDESETSLSGYIDLSNNNLESFVFKQSTMEHREGVKDLTLNLSNTGIHIEFDVDQDELKKRIEEAKKQEEICRKKVNDIGNSSNRLHQIGYTRALNKHYESKKRLESLLRLERTREFFLSEADKDLLEGCYIDGKRIPTKEEKASEAEIRKKRFEEMKTAIFEEIERKAQKSDTSNDEDSYSSPVRR